MIIDWDKYVKNTLPIGIRKPKLIQLAMVLLSGITSKYSDLLDYMNKARLYASCTWQVCWLEFLLRMELGEETINIQEGNGQPYDFEVYNVPYAQSSVAIGIINRFKLAGKSFHLNFNNVVYYANWLNPICAITDTYDWNAQWINPICEKEVTPLIISVTLMSYSYFSGGITIKKKISGVWQTIFRQYRSTCGNDPISFSSDDLDAGEYQITLDFKYCEGGSQYVGQAIYYKELNGVVTNSVISSPTSEVFNLELGDELIITATVESI